MKHSACLDLEGVLTPEIWPWLAHRTGIEGFSRTTRDEPDYSQLMIARIALLRKHGLRLTDVQKFVSELSPLPGAADFLEWVRQAFQVTLVSDAFVQMIEPFWRIFGQPTLRCDRLVCDTKGFITHAQYSRRHGKHEVIEEFQAQGQWVLAVGDAYNDLSMLRRANLGFLYRPPPARRQPRGTCMSPTVTIKSLKRASSLLIGEAKSQKEAHAVSLTLSRPAPVPRRAPAA